MFSIFLIQFLIQSGDLTLDVVAVLTFYLGVIICFTFSFIHHLLSNHSRKIMILTQRLDHLVADNVSATPLLKLNGVVLVELRTNITRIQMRQKLTKDDSKYGLDARRNWAQ
jgi:hypothetical protein